MHDFSPGPPVTDRESPLPEKERNRALDILRGIAVLGILVPNIMAYGQPLEASFTPGFFLTDPGPASDWLWATQFVLVDGKLRGLFALLFGASMALFVERSWARGNTRMLQARRLVILAGFGFAHGVLIWGGDILWSYALIGLTVLPFLHLARERLLVLGLVSGVAGALIYALMTLPVAMAAHEPAAPGSPLAQVQANLAEEEAAMREDGLAEAALVRGGDYGGFVAHNWREHAPFLFDDALYGAFEIFPLMLIGAAFYRYGLFSGGLRRRRIRRLALWAVLGGMAGQAVIAIWALAHDLDYWATYGAFVGFAPIPVLAMSLGLAVLLGHWAAEASGRGAALLAGAGRTAFTNYIGTSFLMMLLFHGWGAGLFGKLNRVELYAIVPLAWGVMLAWPALWLSRFRFGPLEWLWRCLTYGRLFSLRR